MRHADAFLHSMMHPHPSALVWMRGLISLCLLVGLSCAHAADPEAYPNKPLRMIVPFPPGGPVDTVARVVGQRLSTTFGQAVNIDNRPGAGGIVGAEIAARAPFDGYTIFVCAIHHSVLPAINPKLPYDFWRDFMPLAMGATFPIVLVAHTNVPAQSLKELITYAKAHPGKLSYGSAGNGGGTHLAGELFKSLSGTDIVHVPYKGSAPAMTDVLGGQVQLMFADGPTALPQIGGGKVRALMVAQAKRSALFPEVPSATEVGLPGYDAYSWAAFVLPAGVPREHAEKLSNEITKALSNADVRKQLLARGAEAQPGNAEAFTKFMRDEMSKWARVVKNAGIQAD